MSVSVVPETACVAAGGVLVYADCCETAIAARLLPVTVMLPAPPLTTRVVTRAVTVKVVAGGCCVPAPS